MEALISLCDFNWFDVFVDLHFVSVSLFHLKNTEKKHKLQNKSLNKQSRKLNGKNNKQDNSKQK